jgi:hypothetical protein
MYRSRDRLTLVDVMWDRSLGATKILGDPGNARQGWPNVERPNVYPPEAAQRWQHRYRARRSSPKCRYGVASVFVACPWASLPETSSIYGAGTAVIRCINCAGHAQVMEDAFPGVDTPLPTGLVDLGFAVSLTKPSATWVRPKCPRSDRPFMDKGSFDGKWSGLTTSGRRRLFDDHLVLSGHSRVLLTVDDITCHDEGNIGAQGATPNLRAPHRP